MADQPTPARPTRELSMRCANPECPACDPRDLPAALAARLAEADARLTNVQTAMHRYRRAASEADAAREAAEQDAARYRVLRRLLSEGWGEVSYLRTLDPKRLDARLDGAIALAARASRAPNTEGRPNG